MRRHVSERDMDQAEMFYKGIGLVQTGFPRLEPLAWERFWSVTMNLYNRMIREGEPGLAKRLRHDVNHVYKKEAFSFQTLWKPGLDLQNRIMIGLCGISFPAACFLKRVLIQLHDRIA